MSANESERPAWPELDYPAWRDTGATLQLWTQIVGKVRLASRPGSTTVARAALCQRARSRTSPIHAGAARSDRVRFRRAPLVIRTSLAAERGFALEPMTVAEFYGASWPSSRSWASRSESTAPNEIADPIPFPDDTKHASYDGDAVQISGAP